MEGTAQVNGVNLWYRSTGEGEPVVQIHGAGFGHFNFDPATPELSKHFRVVDYDMRGYGAVRPAGPGLRHGGLGGRPRRPRWTRSASTQAHVHGTSMGGMIAIVFAGKYPERTTSVVINCAAAKLGITGPPDLQELDRHRAPGSGRAGQPDPGRADHVAGAFQALPRGGRTREALADAHPADPPRLEPHRGLHRGVPGDVRHGPDARGCRGSPLPRSCSAETRT